VLWLEWLAVVMRCQQDVVTIKVSQRDVRCVSLLGVHEHVLRFRLQLCQLNDLAKGNSLPMIVEAAPACNAMEVACSSDAWKAVELVLRELDRISHETGDAQIPVCRIEVRN
jgi:hypothetical protein